MTAVTSMQISNLLKTLRKSMKTVYSNSPVRCVVNTYRVSIGTSPKSLCPLDLTELFDACERLNNFFQNIHLTTSIYSPSTKTTSTSHTYASTATTVVDALGSSGPNSYNNSNALSSDGLLEERTLAQLISPTYCDTYLRMLDTPSELVASTNLRDYLIDINIYRYAVVNYVLHHINLIKNENVIRMKHVFGASRIKPTMFSSLRNTNFRNTLFKDDSLYTHNSFTLIKNVLNTNKDTVLAVIDHICYTAYKYNY